MVTIKKKSDGNVTNSDIQEAYNKLIDNLGSVTNHAYKVHPNTYKKDMMLNEHRHRYIYEDDSIIGSYIVYENSFCFIFIDQNHENLTGSVIKEVMSEGHNHLYFIHSDNYTVDEDDFYYIEKTEYINDGKTNSATLVVDEKPVGIEIKLCADTKNFSMRELSDKIENAVSEYLQTSISEDNAGVTHIPKNSEPKKHNLVINILYKDEYKEHIGEFICPNEECESSGLRNALQGRNLIKAIVDNIGVEHAGGCKISEMYYGSLVHKTQETGSLRRPEKNE